ncbi:MULTISPECIES: magnesium transporter [unclassified Halomonas]|uniref:Magnesium transporter MgtE n=2 Tax=unclassified Halomonas TaxID=2609666 RepID=A0AAU7KLJ5_9GAMM|nr:MULTISPECIES: magnesium transporter [unclassified Halomonas]MBR9879932.1 magnesium transporter [Gammaproteobacteria bacterium]MBS8268618.1 magnesium transporter [Halomonas litopenaei]KJZ05549.1 magnesium transporter [Halomonas sp. S2151]MAR74250.1 magnesium transporter [Halomonas sp.]MBY6108907.1 magnesium transporter [Halomonas sp. DP1Y21-3]|tara:strand:+ start:2382 stop:3734 length:1353 start_codon:yes stop_codon:yes gene_type:complete
MTEVTETFESQLSRIHLALEDENPQEVSEALEDLEPAEVALLLESLPLSERIRLWEQVPAEDDGEVLLHVHDEVRSTLLEDMDPEEIVAATASLDTADLAELFEDLPKQVAEDMLRTMDEMQRTRLQETLSFEEDSAGRLMRTDAIGVRSDVTLETVQRFLRWKESIPDNTDNLMVVDRIGHFVGVLPLARLVSHDQETSVAELMDADVDVIQGDMKSRDVATLFQTHDLTSAPVVDNDGMLIGRIVIDDIVDVIQENSEQALMNMAGLDEEEDLFAPVLPSAKRRAVWLGINLLTAFLAAWVIGQFEDALEKVVALAVLMPIVASMGGIAGSQTLTLAIRGLALGQISKTNSNWLLRKEVGIALLNGIVWALVVAVLAVLWFKSVAIGVIIAAALVINMLAAGVCGIVIPLVLKRMNIDPALSGSVILTTVTDVIGFMSFLGLATIFLL